MAALKLLMFGLLFSLAIFGIWAESEVEEEILESVVGDSPLKLEIEQLKSKISSLESTISDKSREVKSKDDSILQLEKIIQEKSSSIVSLQKEVELNSKKDVVNAEELVGKARVRTAELEKQVENLKDEVDTQTRKTEALEAWASDAEKKIEDLNLKLENLQRTNDDQKRKIRKTERALQVAEEELVRAQLEATSKSKVLTEIHGAWLPPWLASHVGHYQDLAATHWEEYGKPALDNFLLKASEKSAQAQKWAEPHLEAVKTKWIPVVKEKWVTITTHVGPHVQTVSTKSIEVYEVCRSTITPHVLKIKETTAPYVQEARKFSKPYVDQIATITKPHVDKVRIVLDPYTNRAVYAYGKFLESATTYHQQVQDAVQEKLRKHEFTKALATKELVWFMASASLALPIFFLYKIFSAIFCKKSRKPTRDAQANHAHRRHKRSRNADK